MADKPPKPAPDQPPAARKPTAKAVAEVVRAPGAVLSVVPVAEAPRPADPDTEGTPAPGGTPRVQLKKREFIDKVTEAAGIRKADARAAADATLALLAQALAGGQELVLPPLGRIKVTREKESRKGRILMLRLQLDQAEADDPLAAAADNS